MDWKFGAASDPNASSEILESLFQDKQYWGRLAENPSTPSHALQKLSFASTYEESEAELMTKIFGYLLKNPSSSSDAIVRVLDWVEENQIELCIIPITIEKTNMSLLKVDDRVNIEFDILAKYTEQLLLKRDN